MRDGKDHGEHTLAHTQREPLAILVRLEIAPRAVDVDCRLTYTVSTHRNT